MRDITEHPQFALSPQGDRLALVAAAPGERQKIWIRSFETGVAQPLGGTDGANGLFWAPDGRSLGFQAGGKLKAVSLDGAAPRELTDLAFDVFHGAWSSDGVILFSRGAGGSLFSVPAAGGPAHAGDDARCAASGNRSSLAAVSARRALHLLRQQQHSRQHRRLPRIARVA